MAPGFDPKGHRFGDNANALAGFADANSIPVSFFEDFVVANGRGDCLRAIDAARWHRLLVLDECIAATGSVKAVVEAWHCSLRDSAPLV